MARFAHIISAIDAHTAGEPTRVVLSGLPLIPGITMAEKKRYMMEHLDHFRTLLMHEPRGHNDMFGVIITPPTTDQAQYGLLFMDHGGYVDMCGHGTMSAITVLLETGMVTMAEPETTVVFDTPAGRIKGHARIENKQLVEVSLTNVPSFLYVRDLELDLPDVGKITVDVSFGGNFFAVVRARDLGVAVQVDQVSRLIELGMRVKSAVNEKLSVRHPTKEHIASVELTEIYEKPEPSRPFSRSVVIFGRGQLDRCPCGTGTSATMAALFGRGELPLGVEFINESIIGTRFTGKLLSETRVGDFAAVNPLVAGRAYITGIQQFVVDPDDPLMYGFVLGR
ncbi:proline racemase family protein [Desulforhabdus amnigena]|uniref:Proline racemase n=1 Tax=Desulforhabdus amnigena TaxID=40218 RepID=A0A9W6D0M8_9BACT|nr:proline racemase family protein [Desulforhabdus amnigena]GLI32814.1 proline racemase [Desulforhabdus amnigena]